MDRTDLRCTRCHRPYDAYDHMTTNDADVLRYGTDIEVVDRIRLCASRIAERREELMIHDVGEKVIEWATLRDQLLDVLKNRNYAVWYALRSEIDCRESLTARVRRVNRLLHDQEDPLDVAPVGGRED